MHAEERLETSEEPSFDEEDAAAMINHSRVEVLKELKGLALQVLELKEQLRRQQR